jgi:hypothetical protein
MKRWKSRSRDLYNTSSNIRIDLIFALGADSRLTITIQWGIVSIAKFLLSIQIVPITLEEST